MEKKTANYGIKDPVVPDEVNALIRYASERGIARDGEILINLSRALDAFTTNTSPKVTLSFADKDKMDLSPREAVLRCYNQLAALTQPVNGRTLIDTEKAFWSSKWIMFWTIAFLVLAVSNKMLFLWFDDMPEPEERPLLLLMNIQRYVLDYLSAFFWGGLGSCVYLLKTLSDRASERSFDRRQLQGWGTRIMLGAILGAVVQYLYNPASFTTEAFKLDASAVAFFTGVGVKVVYGAIEKTIDMLASKMNLAAIRRGQTPNETVAAYISQLAGKTRDDGERKLLQKLSDNLSKQRKE